jgi:hypothetical protein
MANGDPSFTIWSRLEPRARANDMARSLQAQIRDPLWMLARQWQVGEFLGSDGGSPVQATIATETQPLTSYRPGPPGGGAAGALDETLPLEAHVEREEVALGLRGRVQLGLRLEAFLRDEGVSPAGIDKFRAAYMIDAAAAGPPAVPDPEGDAWRALAQGRVTDGVKAYVDAAASLPAFPANGPALSTQDEQNALPALKRLVAFRNSLYSEPDHDSPWVERQLHHELAVGSESAALTARLESDEFGGGRLDWYSFELAGGQLGAGQPAQVDSRDWNFIPNHVTLRGQPNSTWWELEDGQTDFGSTDLEKVDLAKLLVMQFAMLYGNDWFELPLPLELGSLASVTQLVVTDTFGQRTLIRPTGASEPEPWSVFSMSGVPPDRDFLLLAPTLGPVQDGDALEDVTFLRDEMAAIGWAVEQKVPGQLDTSLDRHEAYMARLAAESDGPAPVSPGPDDPQIRYLVGTSVPDNWIPLVPVTSTERSFLFRRGVMGQPDAEGAQGDLLGSGRPFYLAEEALPRAGVEAMRGFRRARWIDGSTVVWLGRHASIGRGPGWSGLAFDVVERNES